AGHVDHPLEPVPDKKVAVAVNIAQVPGPEEALAVELDEAFGVGLVVAPVAKHYLGRMRDNFADLAVWQRLQGLGIDDAGIDIERRHADSLALGEVQRIAMQE